ncbi:hypothetical protein EJB05_45403, partial [Eragrostis curvula]
MATRQLMPPWARCAACECVATQHKARKRRHGSSRQGTHVTKVARGSVEEILGGATAFGGAYRRQGNFRQARAATVRNESANARRRGSQARAKHLAGKGKRKQNLDRISRISVQRGSTVHGVVPLLLTWHVGGAAFLGVALAWVGGSGGEELCREEITRQ